MRFPCPAGDGEDVRARLLQEIGMPDTGMPGQTVSRITFNSRSVILPGTSPGTAYIFMGCRRLCGHGISSSI